MSEKQGKRINSMTGFGKASAKSINCACYAEIKSVNHRYLEINTKIPDEFLKLDLEIKKIAKSYIKRGAAYLSLNFIYEAGVDLKVDDKLFQKLLKLEKDIESRHGINQSLNIHYILSYPGVVKQVRPQIPFKEKRELILGALKSALESLSASRNQEGKVLQKDLQVHLNIIEKNLHVIERIEKNRENILLKRMQDQAVKRQQTQGGAQMPLPSIAEEVVRLRSHIRAAKGLLARGGVIGRELDFLAQEMNRETNTVSAKALSSTTARSVVKVKAEIEKIREQALNIE
ncbi:MAG: YicC/YloC family endoribonuclease [Candidatus Saelkia tenebricola]|nr:YicC/YloC family endoribonuclease [Candidatus Saelkia tenebricola]